jgi:Fe-S-cluster containining protein
MLPLKEEILHIIYTSFAEWSAGLTGLSLACSKNCAACCTQNVTMTAVEGEVIHRRIREDGREAWLTQELLKKGATYRPRMTTNDFASACLRGDDAQPEQIGNMEPCPFLAENVCLIYEVRPFACRCFASEERCVAGTSALLPEYYLSASTAVMQIIEHLGQGEYWGNMLDVLAALCDLPENKKCASLLPPSFADQSRMQVIKAQPLPGFLLFDEEREKVAPLLDIIFTAKIGDRTVESILNGGKGEGR